MTWEQVLKGLGIDVDSLEPGAEINLADISQIRREGTDGAANVLCRPDTAPKLSGPEQIFLDSWGVYGDPAYCIEPQYPFDPESESRADFAFPDQRVLVEIEGMFGRHGENGQRHVGRHRSFWGFMRDCEKYNRAACLGWHLYRVPSLWLYKGKHNRVAEVMADLLELLRPGDPITTSRAEWHHQQFLNQCALPLA